MERSVHHKVRLARFIREETERILEDFEEFARTHTQAGEAMDVSALRDHATGMLATIVLDMERDQSEAGQERESPGDAPHDGQTAYTAAEHHGRDRAEAGFSLEEMIAEYRALRASVGGLGGQHNGGGDGDAQAVIRFNEAIDMAMTKSVPMFAEEFEHSREMFLAILAHDLRTPLSAMVTASSYLTTHGGLTGRNLALAERIYSSGLRMNDLVSDLVDITRSNLGRDIPVTPVQTDLAEICQGAVDEVRSVHPTSDLRFEASGNVRGAWDPCRVSQALGNLITNAVQHGSESTPIVVTARGEADKVIVAVHNEGNVIAPEDQELIFDAFERRVSAWRKRPRLRSSGLGLYIAKQIALAHGGSITVRSTVEEGTTFALHLPRHAPA